MQTLPAFLLFALSGAASASTLYIQGTAPAATDPQQGVTLGTHLLANDPNHPSVAGVGGGGISAAGTALDGYRTYIYDLGAQADLTDGVANRGDPGFAMMIWDMGQAFDSLRLYTHQDHYSGGPITSNFTAQDVMEYSVWGSHDGDNFILLSDVVDFDLLGGGVGLPTYTFVGTAPSVVYRGGSAEFGVTNAYTREYVFSQAYRYYGIRTSQVSLTIPGGGVDADPEIDGVGAFNISTRPPGTPGVPEPSLAALLGVGAMGLAAARLRWR
ncbi:MAG: hypothetical protein FJ091_15475 [Deltaproteobacteria bacterium]|nr:hypothetical protein [Deltaproteobacteria bacterium]